jgi:hypothetical protein
MNTTPEQLYATGRLEEAQAACRQRLAGASHPSGEPNSARSWAI